MEEVRERSERRFILDLDETEIAETEDETEIAETEIAASHFYTGRNLREDSSEI